MAGSDRVPDVEETYQCRGHLSAPQFRAGTRRQSSRSTGSAKGRCEDSTTFPQGRVFPQAATQPAVSDKIYYVNLTTIRPGTFFPKPYSDSGPSSSRSSSMMASSAPITSSRRGSPSVRKDSDMLKVRSGPLNRQVNGRVRGIAPWSFSGSLASSRRRARTASRSSWCSRISRTSWIVGGVGGASAISSRTPLAVISARRQPSRTSSGSLRIRWSL